MSLPTSLAGKRTVKKVLKFPIEQRQVPFLISKEALERSSLWGKFQFHDPLTPDVLAPLLLIWYILREHVKNN